MELLDGLRLSANEAEVGLQSSPVDGESRTYWKQVIYVGDFTKWNGNTKVMSFSVSEPDIDNWVTQHTDMLAAGLDVPLPVEHTLDAEKRRGTVLELAKRNDSKDRVGLFAKVRFNDDKIANHFKHSNLSLYSPPVYKHNTKTFKRPIRHIALTDYPVIGDLDGFTIAASTLPITTGNDTMLLTLAKKLGITPPDGSTDEEIFALCLSKIEELLKQVEAQPELDENGNPIETTTTDDGAIAASEIIRNPVVMNLRRKDRANTLNRLLTQDRKITTAQHADLTKRFCDTELKLSDETFEATALSLSMNNTLPEVANNGKSRTTAQGSKDGKSLNPLQAEVQRRNAKATK